MKGKGRGAGLPRGRRDRTVQERVHDPYQPWGKLREPTVCTSCGATYEKGRWTWGTVSVEAEKALCPACHRIRDRFPAGYLHLVGPFTSSDREALLNIARNEEEGARAAHPLARIMGIEEKGIEIVIATTDTHLPRRIGEAVQRAIHGTLDLHYAEDPNRSRVTWRR